MAPKRGISMVDKSAGLMVDQSVDDSSKPSSV